MPRVCILIPRLKTGGAELNLVSLLENGLSNLEIVVVCFKQENAYLDRIRQTGVEILELDYDNRSRLFFTLTLYRVLFRMRPDILHAILAGPSNYACFYKLLSPSTRVVSHLRGSFSLITKRRRFVARRLWKVADRIVVPSQFSKEEYMRILCCPSEKISVVYNGVDVTRFGKMPVARSQGKKVTFGIIARLVPVKAHKTLIQAFHKLWCLHPEVRLLVVGDGPTREKLEGLVSKLGLKRNVCFKGNIENIPNILREIDVCILSSYTENLPNSVLEAQASGRPVIATRVGGVPEIIDHCKHGFLVPAGDSDALARAMLKFVENPKLIKKLGSAARKSVLHRYTIRRNVEGLLSVYGSLLSSY